MKKDLKLYRYRAIKQSSGRAIRGVLTAYNEQHLYKQLHEIGIELLNCRIVKPKKNLLLPGVASVKVRDKISFYTQLEQMQGAGIPLIDVLDNARQTATSTALQNVVNTLYRMVSEGMAMSEAMEQFPRVFSKVEVSITRASEQTGNMVGAYQYLLAHLKSADATRRKIMKGIRYPLIILVFIMAAMFILLGYVTPQIIGFVTAVEGEGELPFLTTSLMVVSGFFQDYLFHMLVAMIAAAVVINFLRQTSTLFRYMSDDALIALPVIGELLRKVEIARFCHTVAVLFASGVTLTDAIRMAKESIGNLVMRKAVAEIETAVLEGKEFHVALNSTGEFPGVVIQMVMVGEETGGLTKTLKQVKDFYDQDVDDAIGNMTAMIEPALTLIMGALIAWIAAAVFGPIYAMFSDMPI